MIPNMDEHIVLRGVLGHVIPAHRSQFTSVDAGVVTTAIADALNFEEKTNVPSWARPIVHGPASIRTSMFDSTQHHWDTVEIAIRRARLNLPPLQYS